VGQKKPNESRVPVGLVRTRSGNKCNLPLEAEDALKGSFSGVDSHVLLENGANREALVAESAREGPDPAVHADVAAQVGFPLVLPPANLATKFSAVVLQACLLSIILEEKN